MWGISLSMRPFINTVLGSGMQCVAMVCACVRVRVLCSVHPRHCSMQQVDHLCNVVAVLSDCFLGYRSATGCDILIVLSLRLAL
jgi:hypothetical protein